MKILIFSDPHIEEKAFEELENSFQHLIKVGKDYNIDVILCLGDLYHKKLPSFVEQDFAHRWISLFRENFKKTILVSGNHDRTLLFDKLYLFKHWGIEVVNNYILDNKYFFGHFFVDELSDYDSAIPVEQLKKENYEIIFLGHDHYTKQLEKENLKIISLGSLRWVNFNEINQVKKYFGIFDSETGKLKLEVNPFACPMVVINSIKELKSLPSNRKVKIVFPSWEEYRKNIKLLNIYKNKFYVLKIDYAKPSLEKFIEKSYINTSEKSFDEIFNEYINSIKSEKVKELIRNVFEKINSSQL